MESGTYNNQELVGVRQQILHQATPTKYTKYQDDIHVLPTPTGSDENEKEVEPNENAKSAKIITSQYRRKHRVIQPDNARASCFRPRDGARFQED
jgi:hypothetical protein